MVPIVSQTSIPLRIATSCVLLLAMFLLAGCKGPLYRGSGFAVRIPEGWAVKQAGPRSDSAGEFPLFLMSRDSNHTFMLWIRTGAKSPAQDTDSRRLRWFAARYASLVGGPLNRWSVVQPLGIEDTLMSQPCRGSSQVYVLSATSPAAEGCIFVFSHHSPMSAQDARELCQEVLHSLSLSNGATPFKRVGNKAVGITSIKSPTSARALNIDGDEIMTPIGWIPEDLLLIGFPGGNNWKTTDHATISLAFTHQDAKRIGSLTLNWAHVGRPEQDVHRFAGSLTRLLNEAGRRADMRLTEVTHVRLPRERVWRLQRFEGAASRPLVQWVCVTDTMAFQATAISNDESSLAQQESAVISVLEQFLKQR